MSIGCRRPVETSLIAFNRRPEPFQFALYYVFRFFPPSPPFEIPVSGSFVQTRSFESNLDWLIARRLLLPPFRAASTYLSVRVAARAKHAQSQFSWRTPVIPLFSANDVILCVTRSFSFFRGKGRSLKQVSIGCFKLQFTMLARLNRAKSLVGFARFGFKSLRCGLVSHANLFTSQSKLQF